MSKGWADEYEGLHAAGRLSAWQASLASGLAQFTVVAALPSVIWLAIDAFRFAELRLFWLALMFQVSSVGCAFARVSGRARTRWMLGNQLVALAGVAVITAPTAAQGGMAMLIAIEAALLLPMRESMATVALALAALDLWPIVRFFRSDPRHVSVLRNLDDPSNALRAAFMASTMAVVATVAISYLMRKITRMLFESEAMIDNLRTEMQAREDEERRRKRAEAELVRAQKLEVLGTVSGCMAHDINNNLTVTLASVELIERKAGQDGAMRGLCESIRQAVENASGLTRQLLTLGRRDVSRPQIVELPGVFERLERLLSTVLGHAVQLTITLPEQVPPVLVDAGQLEQVLLNLAINARDAMPQGGSLTISVRTGSHPHNPRVVTRPEPVEGAVSIEISDTGTGIADAVLPSVLEPFFTTKGPERGTGLGLAVARSFVEASAGRLCIDTAEGQGTTITLELPAARPAPLRAAARRRELGHEGTVLLVDDDARIRDRMAAELRREGYHVLEAADGVEALERAEQAAHIDLLCTDVVMPRMGGGELLRAFRQLHRHAQVLVCSAYVHDPVLRELLRAGQHAVLPKPFSPTDLLGAVAEALCQPAASEQPPEPAIGAAR